MGICVLGSFVCRHGWVGGPPVPGCLLCEVCTSHHWRASVWGCVQCGGCSSGEKSREVRVVVVLVSKTRIHNGGWLELQSGRSSPWLSGLLSDI